MKYRIVEEEPGRFYIEMNAGFRSLWDWEKLDGDYSSVEEAHCKVTIYLDPSYPRVVKTFP